jgi:Xaa-Pro aminopeptidase
MPKSEYLKVRLNVDEARELARQARALNMSKSTFARLLLTGGAVQNQQPPAPTTAAAFEETRIERIEAQIAEMRESLIASARAFDQLLQFLKEQQRVPSFREYRARAAVEQITKRENETEQQYLLRLASRYYVLYQSWPIPSDQTNFGPVPAGFELQKWPTTPPR